MADIKVGKPDVKMDAPSHTPGVRQGNEPGGIENDPGFYDTGERGAGRPSAKSTARRSTGINAEARNPHRPEQPEPDAGLKGLSAINDNRPARA